MAAVDSWKLRSIKLRSTLRNRLKFEKISTKDPLFTKMLKNIYREFDHRGTL